VGEGLPVLVLGAVPVLACGALFRIPLLMAFGVGLMVFGNFATPGAGGDLVEAHRSFFGVYRLTRERVPTPEGGTGPVFNILSHSTTLHGQQGVDPVTLKPIHPRQASTYYHAEGPVGRVFTALKAKGALSEVGVVGLGAGTLAAYGEAGQHFTFFEIDPLVQHLAEDQRYFTFLGAARERGVDVKIVLGDARQKLAYYDGPPFDLLVLDAFSSDAIPLHLLTREALTMYLAHVMPHGLLAVHISTRNFDLAPILGNLAMDLGLTIAIDRDMDAPARQLTETGRASSTWVVMERRPDDLTMLAIDQGDSPWKMLHGRAGGVLWSDDYASILSALRH
jgi:hypothetical protein